ncbi:MAG: hypothetical protein RXR20_34255 [Paraburkholderia sp.]|jgi:hypothetical protein|nr:hypothetical protein [Burkholderia sp. 4M9327F10]
MPFPPGFRMLPVLVVVMCGIAALFTRRRDPLVERRRSMLVVLGAWIMIFAMLVLVAAALCG